MGVVIVRGREVAYMIAPTITPETISTDLLLINPIRTRAKSARVVLWAEDGTKEKTRIEWDALDARPLGATAAGSWRIT